MITIGPLTHVTTAALLPVFNQSFAGYFVPLSLTKEQLKEKMDTENIQLAQSAGVFSGGCLAGFMLHAEKEEDGQKVLYNAGTGIIPDLRGRQLTARMYEYLLPKFRAGQYKKILLEVITENQAAIKAYERIGFVKTRKLDCYKGSIRPAGLPAGYEIKALASYEWDRLTSFWDILPSWQNSKMVADVLRERTCSIGIYQGENLLGYLIYEPKSGKVRQFAIEKNHRQQGLGKALFNYVYDHYGPEISIINVDDRDSTINSFLASTGLKPFISQYEMALEV